MKKTSTPRYSPELRERAVWMVLEHQGARTAVGSDRFDRRQSRLYARVVAPIVPPDRA